MTSKSRNVYVFSNDAYEYLRHLKSPGVRGSCSMIAGMLGLVVIDGFVAAQTAGTVERAARLVQEETANVRLTQVAQGLGDGFAVARISGPANTPLPIPIRIPDIEGGVYNFLVFRYLPENFRMSAGFAVEDRWVVPLEDMQGLTVTAPDGYSGSFQLEIKLRIGGVDKSETRSVPVTISDPRAPVRTTEAATSLSPEKETAVMQRAAAMLDTRDIAGARMLYRYLVKKDSGKGAFGLAQTYDPALLEEIGVAGMDAADIAEARKWYEHAAQLGHEEAQERLSVLAAGTQ